VGWRVKNCLIRGPTDAPLMGSDFHKLNQLEAIKPDANSDAPYPRC